MAGAQNQRQWALRKLSTARLYADAPSADGRQRDQIYDRVVLDHLDLAETIARRYCGPSSQYDFDDIRQVAYLGLVKASRRFSPDRGDDFVSFAVPTISGEIKRYLRDCGWVIKPPRHIQELRSRVNESEPRLAQTLGRTPDTADLCHDLGEDARDITAARAAHYSLRPLSLDSALPGEPGLTLADTVAADDPSLLHAEIFAGLAPALHALAERERTIIYLRFYEEMTQQEIAAIVGVTQMHVSRLLARTLEALRLTLSDTPA